MQRLQLIKYTRYTFYNTGEQRKIPQNLSLLFRQPRSVDKNCFARYLNFSKIRTKTDFVNFLKALIKSRNLNILRK